MKRKMTVLIITLSLLVLGLLYALLAAQGIKVPCLFYALTGLYCPGCGNTRATLALLQLDLQAVLRYNLTYPLQIAYLLRIYVECCLRYIRQGRFAYHSKPDWFDIVCLSLLLLWTILRNCTPLF